MQIIFSGEVVKGKQLARQIGFPTINLLPDQNLVLPKFGVYSAKVSFNQNSYNAVANLGLKPTIGLDNKVTLEAHIFHDIHEELYGKNVCIELIIFIREEKKFNNLEELKLQISKDCDTAMKLFKCL